AVHRTDLVRIRELISGAGGTVLGAVLHGGQPSDQKGGRKGRSKGAGRTEPPAPARQHVPPPAPRPERAADPAPNPSDRIPDPTQHIPGDGSDTVALRMVRPGER
ncbi:lipopolysaccharide biosynthesis protein, partial [Streptomyces sp. NPDC089919]